MELLNSAILPIVVNSAILPIVDDSAILPLVGKCATFPSVVKPFGSISGFDVVRFSKLNPIRRELVVRFLLLISYWPVSYCVGEIFYINC